MLERALDGGLRLVIADLALADAAGPDDESSADGGILPRRVLVVDDQAAVRALVAEALRVDGHTVDTAVDYESALDWLAAGRYDLVLTDDALPGPLGHEVRALAKPLDVAALRRLVAGLRAVGAA